MHTSSNTSASAGLADRFRSSAWYRVLGAWLLVFFAFALAGRIGESAEFLFDLGPQARVFVQAVIMTGIVIGGLRWMLKNLDQSTWSVIAVQSGRTAAFKFLLGFGLFWGPVIIVLLMMEVFGWGSVTLDLSADMLWFVALSLFNVAVFEAIPEELIFRGYIYHNLTRVNKRWVAALITIPLFVALPLLLVPVQMYLLGMEISLGGVAGISGGYVAWMLIFACFQIYLRILSGSVWTTIGFHLAFVLINHLIGPEPGNFIYISDLVQDSPIQPVVTVIVGLILTGLIAWPWLSKAPIGWREQGRGELAG